MLRNFAVAGFLSLASATAASAGLVDSRDLEADIIPDQYAGLLEGMPLPATNREAKEAHSNEELPIGYIEALNLVRRHPRGYFVPLDNSIELVDHSPGPKVNNDSRRSRKGSLGQDNFVTSSNADALVSNTAETDPALQQLNNFAPVIAVPNQITAIANPYVPGQVFVYESLSGSSNLVYMGSAFDPSLWQAQLAAAATPVTTPPVIVRPVKATTPSVTVPLVTVAPITTRSIGVPPAIITTSVAMTTPFVTVVTISTETTPVVTTPAVATLVAVQSAVASPLLASILDPLGPATLEAVLIAALIPNQYAQARLAGEPGLSADVQNARGTAAANVSLDFVNRDQPAAPVSVNAVPEPTTWAMMLIGFAGLSLYWWGRSRLAHVDHPSMITAR